jgi:hypothetical protein
MKGIQDQVEALQKGQRQAQEVMKEVRQSEERARLARGRFDDDAASEAEQHAAMLKEQVMAVLTEPLSRAMRLLAAESNKSPE